MSKRRYFKTAKPIATGTPAKLSTPTSSRSAPHNDRVPRSLGVCGAESSEMSIPVLMIPK